MGRDDREGCQVTGALSTLVLTLASTVYGLRARDTDNLRRERKKSIPWSWAWDNIMIVTATGWSPG